MAKRLSSVLGVDIGSSAIKVCEVKTQGKEPYINALAMVPTPPDSVDHAGIWNAQAVGDAVKAAIKQSGASVGQVVVTIAGQTSVLVRTLEVPRMNSKELDEHMQWEINRNIPFAESTIMSDFKSLPDEDPSSPNIDVVMAIAPQSAVDTVMDCIKRSGRTPVAIDVEPLSMARSLQTSYFDILGEQTVCMVDIGHKTTAINIYRGTKIMMPRQVPVGGEMFTKAIVDAFRVTFDDAERIKRDRLVIPSSAGTMPSAAAIDPFAVPDDAPATGAYAAYNPFTAGGEPAPYDAAAPDPFTVSEETGAFNPFSAEPSTASVQASIVPEVEADAEVMGLYNAIQPVLEELVGELQRSVDYYRSRGGDINRIVLYGGGAKLNGLTPYLNRVLGIETDAYDPLRRLNVNDRKIASGYLDEHRQEFAVAIGNSLHIFFE